MRRILSALAVFTLLSAGPAMAETPGAIPAKTGHASFKFDGVQATYNQVRGDFRKAYGFTVVTLRFFNDGKPASDHLDISLMLMKTGPVDLNQPEGNGIGYGKGGRVFSYVKGRSQCAMTVQKLTPTSVEGVADCPMINENAGGGKAALTGVRFFASGQ